MRFGTLGRTNLRVSEIGIGGIGPMGKYGPIAADGTSDHSADNAATNAYRNVQTFDVAPQGFARTMARAEKLGVNFLDTAPSYGDSELVFGHYLKDSQHRKRWIVCTKIGACGSWGAGDTLPRKHVIEQAEASLKRLQTDVIDVMLIHSIEQYGQGDQASQNVIDGGMVEALTDLKEAGKIRFFGVSGHLPEITAAARTGLFDVILTYSTFNLLVRDAVEAFFPLARELNLGVLLGGVFCSGLLAGDPSCQSLADLPRFFEKKDPALLGARQMVDAAGKLQAFAGGSPEDLRRLGMRFALSDQAVSTVVSGIRSIAEIEENVAAVEAGPLTSDELADLARFMADIPTVTWKNP